MKSRWSYFQKNGKAEDLHSENWNERLNFRKKSPKQANLYRQVVHSGAERTPLWIRHNVWEYSTEYIFNCYKLEETWLYSTLYDNFIVDENKLKGDFIS